MINFRFHVVSIVAVFLSLALGIMIGSTVVDRAIVASLRNQIERVEANADAQR
ncbi:MAG: copper transporter, partial [Actinobacteria bacterium]|nr:copper transporter [Actinomycetota bacterium]